MHYFFGECRPRDHGRECLEVLAGVRPRDRSPGVGLAGGAQTSGVLRNIEAGECFATSSLRRVDGKGGNPQGG